MSELNVASLFDLEKVLQGRSNKLFYSKSEVDKVIAELKQEIERLKEENEMTIVGVNLHSPTSDGRFV